MAPSLISPSSLRSKHHTPFRTELPCVRRGLPLQLSLSPPLSLSLHTSSSSNPFVTLHPSKPSSSSFHLKPLKNGVYELFIPSDAPVGLYLLSDNTKGTLPLAILFNPYEKNDPVYIPDEPARKEYVMNESGLIWRGSAESNFPAPWDYGQFSPYVLRCVLAMVAELPNHERKDPVKVVRYLSARVNSQDDRGVLVGRWDGEYQDGTSPSAWTGSVAILKEYWENGKSVKYGQCWVFAGVLTSLCRAIGIGCRTISNFNSAHDTDRPYNRAVDKYYDENGEYIEGKSADSIWNFHVWSSAWMRRDDMKQKWGNKLDGWQVIDATPQEISERKYQLGPASVNAIKNGYQTEYDADFVIGEVNADVVFYWKQGNKFVARERRRRHVGKRISTKKVGRDEREDVTLEYKYKEGSKEERESLARRPSEEVIVEDEGEKEKVEFDVNWEQRVKAGDVVKMILRVHNKGDKEVKVNLGCLYRAVRYTGEVVKVIGKESWKNQVVGKGKIMEKQVNVGWEEYKEFFQQDVQTIQFVNTGMIVGGGGRWTEDCIVRVYGDDALEIEGPKKIGLGEKGKLKVKIVNGFRVKLTEVVIRVEGEGVVETEKRKLKDVEKGTVLESVVELRGMEKGEKTVVVTLDTKELKDVGKSWKIQVEGKENEEKEEVNEWERWLAFVREKGDWAWNELFG